MTIKSQNDLNQPETHSTEVLLEVISKLETTTKDCHILAKKLLSVKPELEEWIKLNFGEYL